MYKREVKLSSQYKRDYEKAKKQDKDLTLLRDVIGQLANDEPLSPKYRDHALKGKWKGHRECHLTPDWLWFIGR